MKSRLITYMAFLLILLGIPIFLSACSKSRTIVRINSTRLTLDDFLYDIYLIEQEREVWNNTYKESLGVDYWDYEYEEKSMKQLAKDTIMTRVVLYDVLSKQAEKEGYTLSKDEFKRAEENADRLIASMPKEDLKKTGMSRDILIKVYNKLALGDKYYLAVTDYYFIDEEAVKNSIDPDEYREYKTECLYVPTAMVSNQKITTYDDNKLNEAYGRIQAIKELIADGADFDVVSEQVKGATRYNRNFILSDNTAEAEYKAAARELDNGEYSDIITTKFGHYIIHMLDNNSTDRYDEAVKDAIQNEKMAQFKTHYDELLQDYDITINYEYWDSLDLGSITF